MCSFMKYECLYFKERRRNELKKVRKAIIPAAGWEQDFYQHQSDAKRNAADCR